LRKIPFYFIKSLSIIKSEKKIILFGAIPILIGILSYYFLGKLIFGDLYSLGNEYIKSHFQTSTWMNTLFFSLMTIIFFFLINWTFFIFVSIIASPLNDIISSLVDKHYNLDQSYKFKLSLLIKKLPKILINEIKKILLILILSILNFILSFIFAPASFLLAGFILSISFIDYSWSRNDLDFKQCLNDLKKNFFLYLLSGAIFMVFISIPLLNLLFLPFAVVYFTVIYCETKAGADLKKIK